MTVSAANSSQNRRQKRFDREPLHLCRGLDIVKIDKTPLICNVSYFNFGGAWNIV